MNIIRTFKIPEISVVPKELNQTNFSPKRVTTPKVVLDIKPWNLLFSFPLNAPRYVEVNFKHHRMKKYE